MKADLILKSADRQETFPLNTDRATIGRSINAHVRLTDQLVSREHCEILRMGEQYVVRDLASSNGTFVNGKTVEEKVLEWGDKILVGESILIFVYDKTEGARDDSDLEVTPPAGDHTQSIFLRRTDVDLRAAAQEATGGEYLNLLYEVDLAVLDKETVGEICGALVRVLLRDRRFGRAAVVLFNDQGDVAERFSRSEGDSGPSRIRLDAGLLGKVFQNAEAVFSRGQRVDEMSLSSMLVPIRGHEKVHGAIYVDDLAAAPALRDRELHLLSAVGHIVGLAVDRVSYFQTLHGEIENIRRLVASEHEIVGESEAIRGVMDQVRRLALLEDPVLVSGEAGTGKELVARAIHFHSERAGRPFILLHCASVPGEEIRNELFGYHRGESSAFAHRPGRIETAHGGILFLDGAEEMSLETQARLLRFLEEGKARPVGGTREIAVDVRLIAGTRIDLRAAVADGRFLEGLWDRLRPAWIPIPPLRDRKEDILTTALHFLSRLARRMGKRVTGIEEEARERLLAHPWPGNVRELKNLLERAVMRADGEAITLRDLPDLGEAPAPTPHG